MPVENALSVQNRGQCDPRDRLVREKYFCIRPRPMERWLWSKNIPSSAERVFWLHWQEGMQRGDWCSEIPLSRVANECDLDISTVTRAYQLLIRLGCLRRTDPGRNPANPFQQATAITEVRVPKDLLVDLERHPNRRSTKAPEQRQQGRALKPSDFPAPTSPTTPASPSSASAVPDPFPGLSGRDRARALSELTDQMSDTERHAYQEALRFHRPHMEFDAQSKLTSDARSKIQRTLTNLITTNSPNPSIRPSSPGRKPLPRKLSLFELARLNHELQSATSPASAPELMRQVTWSIQHGALRRFDTRHALNIALKKIREGTWSRPHRMPPNWIPAAPEPCHAA